MYYTVIKHSGHLRTLEKCRKHSPVACVFYISLVFSNAWRVLSQCNTQLRLLYLLNNKSISHRWNICREGWQLNKFQDIWDSIHASVVMIRLLYQRNTWNSTEMVCFMVSTVKLWELQIRIMQYLLLNSWSGLHNWIALWPWFPLSFCIVKSWFTVSLACLAYATKFKPCEKFSKGELSTWSSCSLSPKGKKLAQRWH